MIDFKNETKADLIYHIYQIQDVVKVDYALRPFDKVKGTIQKTEYKLMYTGTLYAGDTLDGLWAKHNSDNRPYAQKMRSLSVSDVIVLESEKGNERAFYVDSIGYKEVPEFIDKNATQKNTRRNDKHER